jgi:hypothetical protein
MEEINLDIEDLGASPMPSVNFGGGLEFLMNDKKMASSMSMSADLGDIDKLESDLNKLSGVGGSSAGADTKTIGGGGFSSWFGGGGAAASEPVKNVVLEPSSSGVGQATVDSMGTTKTWDGYTKLSEVPAPSASSMRLTDREKRRKKRAMLNKLSEWYDRGYIKQMPSFNMESSYEEVEDEYEGHLEERNRTNGVKVYADWYKNIIHTLEYANSFFNPFDLNLDGWGEHTTEEIEGGSYDEVLGELYEKYKGGKFSPEISLLMKAAFTASSINISNKVLSSATPGFNDVLKQSPELMAAFRNATVSAMSQQTTNAGQSMVANMMRDATSQGPMNVGPPPPPMETKNMPPPMRMPMQMQQPPPQNRPDISMARGAVYRPDEDYSGPNVMNTPSAFSQHQQHQQTQFTQPGQFARPEMRGPQDLDGILAGLKPKAPQQQYAAPQQAYDDAGEESVMSIASLKDMQNMNMPKRTNRRRNTPTKNMVSLDLSSSL